MNNKAVHELVCELSQTLFNKPFQHQAYFNPRLRTTGGRYMLQTHHIEINPKIYEYYGESELIAVIKHELCHYHLHLTNQGYQHRDADFKNLAKQVGAPRFCQPLNRQVTHHVYYCKVCNIRYSRQRQVDTKRYRCGKCHGEIKKLNKGIDVF